MNIISVCTFQRTSDSKVERGIIINNNVTAEQVIIDSRCKVVETYVAYNYAPTNGCFCTHLVDNSTVNIKPIK